MSFTSALPANRPKYSIVVAAPVTISVLDKGRQRISLRKAYRVI
jgi:hypothetical protein